MRDGSYRNPLIYKQRGYSDLTWLGWQLRHGPSRWIAVTWRAVPTGLLALILWRIW